MIEFNSLNQDKYDFKDNDLICYCFQYTKNQIQKDYLNNGRSTILERITREKIAGGCNCTQKNPKGR